jgi:hypothetical protein
MAQILNHQGVRWIKSPPCIADRRPIILPGRAVPQAKSSPSPQNPRATSSSPTSRQTTNGDLHRRSLSRPTGPDATHPMYYDAMQCLIKADLQGIVQTMNLATVSPNRGGDWSMAEFIVDEVLLRSPSQSPIPRTASITGIASTRHRRPTQSTERTVTGES